MQHSELGYLCKLLCLWDGSIDFLGVVLVGLDDGPVAGHGGGVARSVLMWEDRDLASIFSPMS